MNALLFGSIGSIVETSELQREAFNTAFQQHDLPWSWDQETYRDMLTVSGGAKRISDHARTLGVRVDAKAIHGTKTKLFQEMLAARPFTPRPEVLEALARARQQGLKTGFVTGTEAETVEIIAQRLAQLGAWEFDVVTSRALGLPGKPDPALYAHALGQIGVAASSAVAIEDNVDGVAAAKAAGLTVIASPGENTPQGALSQADAQSQQGLLTAVTEALGLSEGHIH
ncbi:MAG: HAD-IA family hydrolase [Pseudomonadota bacterium]